MDCDQGSLQLLLDYIPRVYDKEYLCTIMNEQIFAANALLGDEALPCFNEKAVS